LIESSVNFNIYIKYTELFYSVYFISKRIGGICKLKILSINDIMDIIHNFIKSHKIEDCDLKTKLYISCLDVQLDKRDIIITLNEVYIYYKLQKRCIYIDGLQGKDQDIVTEYNPDLPILRMYIYDLLKTLTPYERTILILEFYDKLSLKEIGIEVNDNIEHICTTKHNALKKLRGKAGYLIDYLHIN